MLEAMDKEYVLGTYARNYVNFTHGKNATLFDSEGKEYIDFTSGIGVVSVGHGNKRVADAIYDQAQKIIHISNLFSIEPQAKLAKKLVDLSGFSMQCFFANSGAEANEGAIKIARKYGEEDGKIKRYKIITLESSFHGRTISSLKATGQTDMHATYFGPYPDGFVYAKDLEDIPNHIDEHTVGVMIELIQGEGGVHAFDIQQIQDLAKNLKKQNLLLIVDEVQTGVFRTGDFLASQTYNIEPDIITLAKGVGGGVPIGVVMTRLKDLLKAGDHGSTFGGNYLSCRAALEVLDILEESANKGVIQKNIETLEKKLEKTVKDFPKLFENTSGVGLIRGIGARSADIQGAVIKATFEKGVLVLKAGKNRVRFLPPLTITTAEIEAGFERLYHALETL